MRKRQTTLLLLLLLLTGLLLSMTTYAWFSTNRIFEIESFDIQVATKGGIEVSTDAINWKGVVGMLDIIEALVTYPANTNQIPNVVEPVSTAGEVEAGKLKMYYGEVEAGQNSYLSATRSIETAGLGDNSEGRFVAFDLFIRTPTARLITIAPGSGVSYRENLPATGIENAFRLAFINLGTTGLNNSAGAQGLSQGTNSLIWEPNYDVHTPSGIDHARNVYGLTTTAAGATRLPYHGIREVIPRAALVEVGRANQTEYPNYFRLVNPAIVTPKLNTNYQNLFNVTEGITKMRVYIWLEGQDVDCEDNASFGDLVINLQFVAQ